MELRKLEYFVTVVDERSFDKAAQKLFLTQSAVSQQIRRLETEVGTLLIDRSARPFTLTAAGRSVYETAQSMLRQAQTLLRLSEHPKGFRSMVRVGVTRSLLFSFVTARIREIRQELTGVHIELLRDSTNRLLADVVHGAHDIIITNTQSNDPRYVNDVIWNDPLVLAYNIHHAPPGADKGVVKVEDLLSRSVLTFSRGVAPANYDRMLGYFADLNITPLFREVPASYVELLGYIRSGSTVGIIAKSVADVLPLLDVAYAELQPTLPSLPVYCTWNPHTSKDAVADVASLLGDPGAVERLTAGPGSPS
ncbi:LysR family transcriptional regulator [Brevibacterium sp. SMBL_HHYL_HB1]|uniref:LysR family transcriptional regulator n=1 Tax=Brevibacterium sp. SMBL_HHYL_HB1 TaxID=2777556 RepID=UPI001BAC7545|nr:LysR family transcriptional regulator [Brevibacterium sp. SMBL_HHYL_HB1]QUL80665.1 LysR family transcriptional regulator [Brevibacterium sp. SMBL_HHYL_HB1]